MKWAIQVLLALDQLVNAMLGGWADEALSARAHRMKVKGHPYWGWIANAINQLFFWQADHCLMAYEAEAKRWQLPPEFRGSDANR